MKIGASSFASPLHELKNEVESIELYIPKLGLYKGNKMIKERVDELSEFLSTCSTSTTLHAPYYGDSPGYPEALMVDTSRMNRSQFHLMEESIGLANEFGCSIMVIHPGKIIGNREKCFNSMVRNLKKLAISAENCGITLGLENKEGTDPTNLCCSAIELLRAVSEVDLQNLKVTFDIGHANLTCGGNMVLLKDFARELKGNVVHVHVHDNNGMNGDRYFGDLHGAPGEGNIDFSILREMRHSGVFNLEVFTIEDVRTGKIVLKNC